MSEPSTIAVHHLREVEDASNYAVAMREDMVNLSGRVDDMGSFRLWWDKKVPENEKWFFNRIAWSSSDPKVLQETITKHKDFYEEMRVVVRQVREGAEDADELIQVLYGKLLEMKKESELGINSTNSKTLAELHKEFVEKHQMLESKIKRVECVAVRQQLKKTHDDWKKAVSTITELSAKLEESCQLNKDQSDKFEKLMVINQQLVIQQQELKEENTLIKTLLEELIRRGDGGAGGSRGAGGTPNTL